MSATNRILVSFAAGAVIGGITGLLIAPESGDKTRKKILKQSKRLQEDMADGLKEKVNGLKKTYNTKLKELTATNKK